MSNSKRWRNFMQFWDTISPHEYHNPADMYEAISVRIRKIKDHKGYDESKCGARYICAGCGKPFNDFGEYDRHAKSCKGEK